MHVLTKLYTVIPADCKNELLPHDFRFALYSKPLLAINPVGVGAPYDGWLKLEGKLDSKLTVLLVEPNAVNLIEFERIM